MSFEDACSLDAGSPDAGSEDGVSPDAGSEDAGSPDEGSTCCEDVAYPYEKQRDLLVTVKLSKFGYAKH